MSLGSLVPGRYYPSGSIHPLGSRLKCQQQQQQQQQQPLCPLKCTTQHIHPTYTHIHTRTCLYLLPLRATLSNSETCQPSDWPLSASLSDEPAHTTRPAPEPLTPTTEKSLQQQLTPPHPAPPDPLDRRFSPPHPPFACKEEGPEASGQRSSVEVSAMATDPVTAEHVKMVQRLCLRRPAKYVTHFKHHKASPFHQHPVITVLHHTWSGVSLGLI